MLGGLQQGPGGGQDALESLRRSQYAKIMGHEQAHASAAGSFGGPIHIDYDANGIAIGGHVPISMPGLDPGKPEESYRNAQIVFGAACAPGADMSGQDASVASRAQALMGQAKLLMDARQQRQQGPQPGGNPFAAGGP